MGGVRQCSLMEVGHLGPRKVQVRNELDSGPTLEMGACVGKGGDKGDLASRIARG